MKSTGLVLKSRNYIGSVEPPATVLEDESRWGNDGAITGATWTQLPSGLWVLKFDALNEWVDCGNPAVLNLTSPFSVEIWVKATSLPASHQFVIGKSASVVHPDGWALSFHTDRARFYIGAIYAYETGFQTDTWCHRVGTFDKDLVDENIKAYVNAGTATTRDLAVDVSATTKPFRIGANGDGDEEFTGFITLPKIYNRVLSPAEILKHFTAERAWFGV